MFKFFNKVKKQYIALDIGSQTTKIATYSRQESRIDTLILKPTPPETFDSGDILNEENCSQFINDCLAGIDIESEISAITGVSGKGLITKKIDIPNMDEDMIADHLPFEAEQYLPYEIDEMELHYEILKDLPASVENHTPILLIAILKKLIGKYEEVFFNSLIECDILDANVLALFNIFEKNYELDSNANYLLIDIGFKGSNIVAIINNQVVFTRHLLVGGDFYTHKIKNSLNLNYEEAEDLKKSIDVADSAQDVTSLINTEIHPAFCNEVFSGYEFYLSFFPESLVSQIYVTGGGSQVSGLTEALSQKFSAQVEILDTFKNVGLSAELESEREKLHAFSAVVSGLALRME